jgi:hypothetical protein
MNAHRHVTYPAFLGGGGETFTFRAVVLGVFGGVIGQLHRKFMDFVNKTS